MRSNDDGFLTPPSSPLRGRRGPIPEPYIWDDHTPDEQAAHLVELTTWVDWVLRRYRLDHRTVPGCWPQHPELLEELDALALAWHTAYSPLAHGDAPLIWHEHLHSARTRLTDAVARTGCRPGEHRGN